MNRSQRWSAALGVGLVLLYVLPLFFPPGASVPADAEPRAGMWQRIFPGVPEWWSVGRLLCLFCGAALLAWSTKVRLRLTLQHVAEDHPASGENALRWCALFLATGHVIAGLFAAQFSRRAEIAYFVFLAIPTVVLALGDFRRTLPMLRIAARRGAILLLVPLLWLGLCAPAAWRSPRAANLIDMWVFIERLERVVSGQQKILADTTGPGHTNAYMMLQGIWLLGPDQPPTFVGLQIAHAILGITCAVFIGAVAWLLAGRAAALVAQAALLFSPYGISSLYEPAPMFFTCLCVGLLLLLLLLVRRFRSEAALAAFGIAAGIAVTDPPAGAMTLVLCAAMGYALWQFSRLPWLAAGVGALSGAAAILPSVPTPGTLLEMARQYTFGQIELAGIVRILFGQETPFIVGDVFKSGGSGPFDLPIGALLTPFAIARTPMRLWGDVLFEPIATVLMTVGLLLCVRHLRRNRAAGFLLVLLLVQLTQGFAATGDAVSHTRLAPALIPMTLLSGVGFATLRRTFASERGAVAAIVPMVAAIALSGVLLFSIVTPTIIPSSSLAISLEALGTRDPNAEAVFLQYDRPINPQKGSPVTVHWLYVAPIAELLPRRPQRTLHVSELERQETNALDSNKLYFWSPALESDANVSREICARWPGAALYTLLDPPKLFSALAAAPTGDVWRPKLPQDRWMVTSCAR